MEISWFDITWLEFSWLKVWGKVGRIQFHWLSMQEEASEIMLPQGVTPFIFVSSLHWFLRQRNVVFNITLPSHYDPLFVMSIDDKYDLYTQFCQHCLSTLGCK